MSQGSQVTEEEACSCLTTLERFCKDAMNSAATDVPDLEDVKFAFAGCILWFGLNERDYEIRDIIRIFESSRGISYSKLTENLRPVVEHLRQSMEFQRARRGRPLQEDELPF